MTKPKKKKLKVIEATKINLVDSSGKTRISLDAAGPQNTVLFNLFGTSGEGLQLCLDNDQNPKITLTDKQGNPRIAIGISDDLGAGLSLHNAKKEIVVLVYVDAETQELRVVTPRKDVKLEGGA